MKVSLKNKVDKICSESEFPFKFFYSDTMINYDDDYYKYKHFLIYHNTYSIYKAFRYDYELEEFINDMLN